MCEASAPVQIPWVKSCLLGSDATWNAIVGHYALWGSDTNYADPSLTSAAKTAYPGQCGAWASVRLFFLKLLIFLSINYVLIISIIMQKIKNLQDGLPRPVRRLGLGASPQTLNPEPQTSP